MIAATHTVREVEDAINDFAVYLPRIVPDEPPSFVEKFKKQIGRSNYD
jgi:hypothetical protein